MTGQEKWDRRFLALAKEISTWSKDPSTKVGAVIFNDLHQMIGHGYNGFPRGVSDSPSYYSDRTAKYKMIVHAELNAVLHAGDAARGCTLYVYPAFAVPNVCNECAKAVIQAGIKTIVQFTPTLQAKERAKRWTDELEWARCMLLQAGITWRDYYE